ncbi:DUF2254 domain-containing protein [Flavimaricola marinus]|uniref:DUF2254 domain-containing protein n=1 Tax=Flavimaricola marinus TaxID=1819565 RepID=A0A238LCU9_9RHOB|nr:DUF2254 domain-containing protein [Flavimaricola marinus]SMY07458.1 hypothetical protein LOM8899_01593 [Flavimaricola marinus]
MNTTLLRKARSISRRLWVRVALISVLGFVAIGLAKLFGTLIPSGLAEMAGADALDRLLTIISNSMLTATTFSLTVMVTVHRAASQQWTPRAHRTLLQDTTTQTVLATFVGAYIYAVAAIILLSTPFFGEREVFALYLMTVLVIALIVFVILRWILHLQTWGSLMDTAGRIEVETIREIKNALNAPCLSAHPWTDETVPPDATPVFIDTTAYIQEVYQESLQEIAETADARIYLEAPVGRFVHEGDVIAWMVPERPGLADKIRTAVRTGALRSIAQDPRFGLLQLAEIGSKALSPGINDTGTAIDVVGRLTRILRTTAKADSELLYDRLWVRPFSPDDMIEDAFAVVSRDAGNCVEVHMSLIKNLDALSRLAEPGLANAAQRYGPTAFARAAQMIDFPPDLDRLREITPPAFVPEK